VVAVIVVELVNDSPVAAVPPIVTLGVAIKSVPVIVTLVPPVVGPEFGDIDDTVGGSFS
jgi:hypothetical protein